MKSSDLLRTLVLSAIADNYENSDWITENVVGLAGECGIRVGRPDVERTIGDLIEEGLAKAYRLTAAQGAAEEMTGIPTLTGFGNAYFLISESGLAVLRSYPWPFDEDDSLRENFRLEGGSIRGGDPARVPARRGTLLKRSAVRLSIGALPESPFSGFWPRPMAR